MKKEFENKRYKYVIFFFDRIFDKLEIEKKYDDDLIQLNWIDSETGKKLFERNHWGMFWIYDCQIFRSLKKNIVGILNFSTTEFKTLLLDYLNDKYKKVFEGRNLKELDATEECEDYEFDEELNESLKIRKKIKRLIEITEFEEDSEEKKKETAKRIIQKYLTMKVRYTDKYGEEFIDFKKNGSTQLQYSIQNISSFNGNIERPVLKIGYRFLKQLMEMFPFEKIISQDEVIQLIINWFNQKYKKNVFPNSWGWIND